MAFKPGSDATCPFYPFEFWELNLKFEEIVVSSRIFALKNLPSICAEARVKIVNNGIAPLRCLSGSSRKNNTTYLKNRKCYY